MNYRDNSYEWTMKDGSLSDKTATKEFGLSQKDIIKAINEGKLQYREGSVYGNPYLRLLRSEVEKLAEEKFGIKSLAVLKAKTQIKKVNKELSELKLKVARLENLKWSLDLILEKDPSAKRGTKAKGGKK